MNTINQARRRDLRLKQYGGEAYVAFICSHPCAACGRAPSFTVPAHAAKTRGAGGTWRDIIPCCWICETELHANGIHTFEGRYEIDCGKVAAQMVAKWETIKGTDSELTTLSTYPQ